MLGGTLELDIILPAMMIGDDEAVGRYEGRRAAPEPHHRSHDRRCRVGERSGIQLQTEALQRVGVLRELRRRPRLTFPLARIPDKSCRLDASIRGLKAPSFSSAFLPFCAAWLSF